MVCIFDSVKLTLLVFILSISLYAQSSNSAAYEDSTAYNACWQGNFGIPNKYYGIGFGNSPVFGGIRFNFSDCCLEKINGLNITLMPPSNNVNSEINGVAIGLIGPSGGRITGLSVAGVGIQASEELNGISISPFASYSDGTMSGIQVGGLALVAQDDMTGINLAGFGVDCYGEMKGLNFGGVAIVSDRGLTGINFGGFASISVGNITGLNYGGFIVYSKSAVTGVNLSCVANIAESNLTGINIGGITNASTNGDLMGINISAGALEAKNSISAFNLAGYRITSNNLSGLSIASVITTTNTTGISASVFHHAENKMNGISFSLVNWADELKGIQIGLINIVSKNRIPFKVLPFFNFDIK